MIKTKQDLEAIKLRQQPLLKMREGKKRFRIVVSLGEDNQSAKETLAAFIETLDALKIYDCAVFYGPKHSSDQIPVVQIHGQGRTTTYVHVTKSVVPKLIDAHIVRETILTSHVKEEPSC